MFDAIGFISLYMFASYILASASLATVIIAIQ